MESESESSSSYKSDSTGSVTRVLRRSSSDDESTNLNNEDDCDIYTNSNNIMSSSLFEEMADMQENTIEHISNCDNGYVDENSIDFIPADTSTFNTYDNFINDYEESLFSSDEESAIEEDNELGGPISPLLKFLQNNKSNETITSILNVNIIQILTAIFNFAKVYSMSHSAIADMCRMINSFFDQPILPNSRYLIDKLCYNRTFIDYHGVCTECKNYIKQFQDTDRHLHCEICNNLINVKDPNYRDFFVILDIKTELRNLIERNFDYYNLVLDSNSEPFNKYSDIKSGRKYREFWSSLSEDDKKSYICLTFNSDGSPIFKSSNFSIWPIQAIVNEIDPNIRNKNPITVALWFGHDKPDMNIFLTPFVEKVNQLSEEGFCCRINNIVKKIKVFGICCCVDSVARAPMQGIVQFNGHYGCSWCLHPGKMVFHNRGQTMKYTLLNEMPQKRDELLSSQHILTAVNSGEVVCGFKKASPLLCLKSFNIIDGFVPDAMHCIALGIAKQFANYWFNPSNAEYRISNANIKLINKMLNSFKVPTQLARLSRNLVDRKFWKAREYENWVLYYSLPILSEIENFKQYFNHWSLLVEAFHLLMQDIISIDELNKADRLLKTFVGECQLYYTEDAMTYNVHQLIHMSQSVADWGPIWAHSGYPFESGNGQIVKHVHAAKGVLNQMCRNISMSETLRTMEKHIENIENCPVQEYIFSLKNRLTWKTKKIGKNRYFQKSELQLDEALNLNIILDDYEGYDKLLHNNCIFKTCRKILQRSDNTYAITDNGKYIQIVKFLVGSSDDKELTICKELVVQNSLNTTKIKEVVNINDQLSIIETSSISKVCVYMKVKTKCYISAISNIIYYS